MRTIAIEEHFMSTGFRKEGLASGVPFEFPLEELTDLDASRLNDMDVNGIDLQVISHTVVTASLSNSDIIRLTRDANDQLHGAIAEHPDRFAGFATLPMVDPEKAVEELDRTVGKLGFKGALIDGRTNGRFLDDPLFFPILERAAYLDVPIYIHPNLPPTSVMKEYYGGFDAHVSFVLATTSWGWHSELGLHALRLVAAGVFDRLPSLQIIVGHMGEMIPFMLGRIDDWLTPVAKHLQRKIPEYFKENFYFTTSGLFTDPPLLCAMQTIGVDRIIFSVDYPYSKNEQGRKFLDKTSINAEDKEKICHVNAERLLGLSAG